MKIDTVQEARAPYGIRKTVAELDEAPVIGESRVILNGIRWETFEALCDDIGESGGYRLAYDEGMLEIMAPFYLHESSNRFLEQLIIALADFFGYNIQLAGEMMCKRKEFKKGLQPDSCYYIQNAHRIRPKEDIDLTIDPPPDLMLEVDIGNSSMKKHRIYAALGVPEIWRYGGKELEIRVLSDGEYRIVSESTAFPGLPLAAELPKFIAQGIAEGCTPMLKDFRKWLRTMKRKS